MGLNIAVDGPSNAGKSTLTRELARQRGWQVLPDAGDLVSIFPPAPQSRQAACDNERYCRAVEEARAALLRTGWRTSDHCLLDRSAISTLAISYAYAPAYGDDVFATHCAAMADSVRSGRLVLPDAHLYLRPDTEAVTTRNRERPEPLNSFWLRPTFVLRQLHFYDVWMRLLPESAGATVRATAEPAVVLAEASRTLDRLASGRHTPQPGPQLFDELVEQLRKVDTRPLSE